MASQEDIQARVIKVIREYQAGCFPNVSLDTKLVVDLQMDSLDTLEMVMAVEDEFNIEIPDQNVDELVTVQDVVNLVCKIVR